jgi:mono/diheme cytochrome c family protein
MKFLSGFLTAVLLLIVLSAACLLSGAFNTAAAVPPGPVEKKLAGIALDRSVARRAPKQAAPASNPETLKAALGGYKEMCLVCHGAPGVETSEIAAGLNPAAPDLTLARVQRRSDGEIFWIVQNGIRMTGMPAFGSTHKDEALWRMVAFVRHLPQLTPDEEKELKAGSEGEGEEHEHGGEAEHHEHEH